MDLALVPRAGLLVAAALVLAGCDPAAAEACVAQLKPPGEVHGSVGAYVPCNFPGPACGENDPAYRPVPGVRVVFTSLECGGRTFDVQTGGDGTYDVVLPEGRYRVDVTGGRDGAVSVESGRHVELNLRQDTAAPRLPSPATM